MCTTLNFCAPSHQRRATIARMFSFLISCKYNTADESGFHFFSFLLFFFLSFAINICWRLRRRVCTFCMWCAYNIALHEFAGNNFLCLVSHRMQRTINHRPDFNGFSKIESSTSARQRMNAQSQSKSQITTSTLGSSTCPFRRLQSQFCECDLSNCICIRLTHWVGSVERKTFFRLEFHARSYLAAVTMNELSTP